MSISKSLLIFIFKFSLKSFLIQSTLGHGRMIDPPQRGSMWRFGFDDVALPNYNDMVEKHSFTLICFTLVNFT
jgi:hypothetical protein